MKGHGLLFVMQTILIILAIFGIVLTIYGEIAGTYAKDCMIFAVPLEMKFKDYNQQLAYRACWVLFGIGAFVCLFALATEVLQLSWFASFLGALLGAGFMYLVTIIAAYGIFAIGFVAITFYRYCQKIILWLNKVINKP